MKVVALAQARSYAPSGELAIRPARALQVALLLLAVGNLGRIPVLDLGDRAAPLLINDLAVVTVLALGALAMLRARSLKLTDVAIAALCFACIGGLSAIAGIQRFGLSTMEVIGSLAYLARWAVYFCLYLVVVNCVRATDVEGVWSAVETTMLLITAFGIVQAIFLPDFAFMVYPDATRYDWDAQRHRLVSTILDPNIVAGMIATVLLIQLARMASGTRVAWWKPLMMAGGLALTLSRGGIASFLVGGAILVAVFGLSRKLLRFALIVAVLALAALPRLVEFANQYRRFSLSDESALARVAMWQRAVATFLDYPWFGIGFNTWGFVQERRGFERMGGSAYSAEGGLLFVAVLTGIVGLCAYVAMLWLVLRRSKRSWRDRRLTPGERGLLIGTAAATVTVVIQSLFVNSLFTPWLMEPLWVLWGLTFIIATDLPRRSLASA